MLVRAAYSLRPSFLIRKMGGPQRAGALMSSQRGCKAGSYIWRICVLAWSRQMVAAALIRHTCNAASHTWMHVDVKRILVWDCKQTHALTSLWQDHTAPPTAKKSLSESGRSLRETWLGSKAGL